MGIRPVRYILQTRSARTDFDSCLFTLEKQHSCLGHRTIQHLTRETDTTDREPTTKDRPWASDRHVDCF
jgi:hypothetical protein